jgi:hypothetical protein
MRYGVGSMAVVLQRESLFVCKSDSHLTRFLSCNSPATAATLIPLNSTIIISSIIIDSLDHLYHARSLIITFRPFFATINTERGLLHADLPFIIALSICAIKALRPSAVQCLMVPVAPV